MSILNRIFGSGQVIEKGIDLIDSWHTSEPELIAAQTKAKVDLLQSYAPFKVAQRYLAVVFTVNFVVAFWFGVGLWIFKDDMVTSGVLDQGTYVSAYLQIVSAFWVGEIMAGIVGFYFGGGLLESRNKKAP